MATLLVAGAALGLFLLPFPAAAQPYPNYNFQIKLSARDAVVQARMEVVWPAADAAPPAESSSQAAGESTEGKPHPAGQAPPGEAWWFHLPPNRFADEDSRGDRRQVDSLPIGFRFSTADPIDPMRPNGFTEGSVEIHSVEDDQGRPLEFSFEDNTRIPPGYWSEKALLRVALPPGYRPKRITIAFSTHLPNQNVDGWDYMGVLAELWHPVLLPFRDGQWDRDPFAPAGGVFGARIESDEEGVLLAGNREPVSLAAGEASEAPRGGEPQRVFPLIFLRNPEVLRASYGEVALSAFFQEGNESAAALALETARQFYDFVRDRFGLEPPHGVLNFTQSDIRIREMFTVGHTVVIPTVFLKNNPILDRVYVGKLTRAIAEIWFGETVWSNRDTQAWLHLGLTGYLALEFFKFRYGWDASIHDLVDWLSPKYREHFFEAPVLSRYRDLKDRPLTLSLYHHPNRGEVMLNLFQKAPLVFRSLAYVVGDEAFSRGLALFYRHNRHREITIEDFRKAIEEASGMDLGWYFDGWFYGKTRLDYALGEWSTEPVAEGYRVTVTVERREAGIMPVEVQVQTEEGAEITQRWDGKAERATLHFNVASAVKKIVLDPREYLIEANRQNNHSSRDIRWRPFYDWSKQRESLVTIVARLGGNAIDGNIIGIGANIRFNEENNLRVIPIYGENSKEALFELSYIRRRFLQPRLAFLAAAFRLGGQQSVSAGLRHTHSTSEKTRAETTFLLTAEQVEAASLGASAEDPIQQAGNTNNFSLINNAEFRIGKPHSFSWSVEAEHSRPELGSDFEYSALLGTFAQNLDVHVNHSFRFEFIRGLIDGDAPIQKKHLLGDPLVLRGFPRTVDLVSDNITALRSEYRYVLTRRIYGETIQTRKITLFLFADIGKGWNNNEKFDDALTRRDVGLGFNIDFNALSLLEFPLRVEIAFPQGDPVYKDSQLIFFQALAFF